MYDRELCRFRSLKHSGEIKQGGVSRRLSLVIHVKIVSMSDNE